ncbi:hypothetical protein AMTR_s00047p00127280 [Amborella trichopoda]|uniref:Uncharacterized protein n=1 Tax=Amborella trichopoda TaxID=13333 RepID=U5D5P5_AMBTC|nr:hypothetical protein AMTR_s00047p00127280 [Amborella trichopoda]
MDIEESRPAAKPFQDKPVTRWRELCIIIGDDIADGGGARTCAEANATRNVGFDGENVVGMDEEVNEQDDEVEEPLMPRTSVGKGAATFEARSTTKKGKKRKKTNVAHYWIEWVKDWERLWTNCVRKKGHISRVFMMHWARSQYLM